MSATVPAAGSANTRPRVSDGRRRTHPRVVQVRALEPRDRQGLAAAIERLSPESRYLRFATPKQRMTDRELDFLLDVNHHQREALLAVDPSTGDDVGVVRYVEIPDEPPVAEIAATVADDWQEVGLGRALLGHPTEVRTFEKGRFELYRVGPMTLGRASYEPGWRWSEHVGPATGEGSCQVEHVGLVLSGEAVARMDDGREIAMRAGDFFYIPPGHDNWVVGDEPYVSLHREPGLRDLVRLSEP